MEKRKTVSAATNQKQQGSKDRQIQDSEFARQSELDRMARDSQRAPRKTSQDVSKKDSSYQSGDSVRTSDYPSDRKQSMSSDAIVKPSNSLVDKASTESDDQS